MAEAHDSREPKRVLVVDDDEVIRDVLTLVLEDEGYAVDAAADGLAALELLDRHGTSPPDVVLLDYTMPRCDGPTFAREYRRRGTPAPIVLLTASFQLETRCREVAADGCIGKPFDVDHLVTAIQDLTHIHDAGN